MKIIKFRVWTGSEMEYNVVVGKFGIFYVNPSNNGIDENDTASLSTSNTKYPNDIPLMQFTGLTDRTGKEVFEGDIVKNIYTPSTNVVKYDLFSDDPNSPLSGSIGFCLTKTCGFGHDVNGKMTLEVIGNIHENPECLIKGKYDDATPA